jgi:hypothetical protein
VLASTLAVPSGPYLDKNGVPLSNIDSRMKGESVETRGDEDPGSSLVAAPETVKLGLLMNGEACFSSNNVFMDPPTSGLLFGLPPV